MAALRILEFAVAIAIGIGIVYFFYKVFTAPKNKQESEQRPSSRNDGPTTNQQ